jgi:peptidoglycan-N-acetylglucosamine deacetylase
MSLRGAVGGGVGRAGRRMLYGTRGVGRLSSRLRPRACVLMYHRVASPVLDPFGQAVAQKHFVEHLEAVRSRFHVVSVAQLIDGLRKGDYPDGAVAVTFDDGYADTLATAYPAAAALGVPFHVFVTAGPVSAEEQVFWWDELPRLAPEADGGYGTLHNDLRRLPSREREARLSELRNLSHAHGDHEAGRPLTPEELRELARLPLATIGSHTLTHSALAALSPAEQLFELTEARHRLEAITGDRVDALAYPFGKEADVTNETRELAARAGYRAAFLSTPRALVPTSDVFGLPRLAVHDWPAAQLLERIHHVLGPLPSLRPRRRKHSGVVYHGGRRRRAIALTFDDGPSEWTPAVLDILREHGARATFFVLGSAVRGREETLRRTVTEGHELGNHFYEHRDPAKLPDAELVDQLERAGRAVADVAGTAPRLVRPPYGHDGRRVARVAATAGLGPIILGSIDPSDWRATTSAPIVRHVLIAARPGSIVFLHDGVPPADDTAATRSRVATVEAVVELVPELTARGFDLVTVSELIQ